MVCTNSRKRWKVGPAFGPASSCAAELACGFDVMFLMHAVEHFVLAVLYIKMLKLNITCISLAHFQFLVAVFSRFLLLICAPRTLYAGLRIMS